jgi:hypothetical protein
MFRPIRMDHTNCLQVAIKTLQLNGRVQRDKVTVHQNESIFDCLVAKFGGSQYWTKLHYRVNGVQVTAWRLMPESGIPNRVQRFKCILDRHFQAVFTLQDRPKCEIYLRHT